MFVMRSDEPTGRDLTYRDAVRRRFVLRRMSDVNINAVGFIIQSIAARPPVFGAIRFTQRPNYRSAIVRGLCKGAKTAAYRRTTEREVTQKS